MNNNDGIRNIFSINELTMIRVGGRGGSNSKFDSAVDSPLRIGSSMLESLHRRFRVLTL